MEMIHWWLIKMVAIQTLCLIGVGYGICYLAKQRLVMAKAKAPAQTFIRIKKSSDTGISLH